MSLEGLYQFVGISRQGLHGAVKRQQTVQDLKACLVKKGWEIRQRHPRMGARSMFDHLQMWEKDFLLSIKIGKNKFENLLLNNGFRLPRIRCKRITTRGNGFRFPNRVKGLTINQINQVWSSDITYWEVWLDGKKRFFYITLIIDVYSRRVIGWALSKTLHTEVTTLPALHMALQTRNIRPSKKLSGLIFHSDAGGQYYDGDFLDLLQSPGAISSMAETAIDNPFSERLNGTIKNQYLEAWNPNSESQLQPLTQKAIEAYNVEKPHRNLKNLSPVLFEQKLFSLPINQRTSFVFK